MNKKEKMNNKKRDKFVRYGEGATMYHMGLSKFMQLAKRMHLYLCHPIRQRKWMRITNQFIVISAIQ